MSCQCHNAYDLKAEGPQHFCYFARGAVLCALLGPYRIRLTAEKSNVNFTGRFTQLGLTLLCK